MTTSAAGWYRPSLTLRRPSRRCRPRACCGASMLDSSRRGESGCNIFSSKQCIRRRLLDSANSLQLHPPQPGVLRLAGAEGVSVFMTLGRRQIYLSITKTRIMIILYNRHTSSSNSTWLNHQQAHLIAVPAGSLHVSFILHSRLIQGDLSFDEDMTRPRSLTC